MRYDAFLSHNHADKVWTRALFDHLSAMDYDGRALRIWLDERVLDPGNPASARELDSALECSRTLVLVLSPEALASAWVQHEIVHFRQLGPEARVVVVQRRACALPAGLEAGARIDWTAGGDDSLAAEDPRLATLSKLLCPEQDSTREWEHRRHLRRLTGEAQLALGQGFGPRPTPQGDALVAALLEQRIDALDTEGLAMAGFGAASQRLAEFDDDDGCMLRLLLGDALAEATLRHPAYAQVAADLVRSEARDESHPSFATWRNRALAGRLSAPSRTHRLFCVARAARHLAALAPERVDLSTLAAVLQRLDCREATHGPSRATAVMIGRVLATRRNHTSVGVLLHAAARWGGWASRSAVAAALSCPFDEFDPHVFCSTAVQKRYADVGAGVRLDPPAPRVARLLMDPALAPWLGEGIENAVTNARADYRRAYGAFEAPDARWEALRVAPMPESLNAGPLIGTVRRITRADMEARARALNAAEIACLTEPRIVDALFDRVGGFVIDSAQSDGALGARLRARGVRFAAVPAAVMSGLGEGLAVAWWPLAPDGGNARVVGLAAPEAVAGSLSA